MSWSFSSKDNSFGPHHIWSIQTAASVPAVEMFLLEQYILLKFHKLGGPFRPLGQVSKKRRKTIWPDFGLVLCSEVHNTVLHTSKPLDARFDGSEVRNTVLLTPLHNTIPISIWPYGLCCFVFIQFFFYIYLLVLC